MRSNRRVASGKHPALFHISEVVLYAMSVIVFETPMASVQELFFSYPLLLDELPFTMIAGDERFRFAYSRVNPLSG
jgi:hypothetical protein